MRRAILAAVLLVCLGGCAAMAWAAHTSTIAPYVLPGASDVSVTNQGVSKLVITYRAPGQPYEWNSTLEKLLLTGGWRGREYTFSGTRSPFIVMWYTRSSPLGPLQITESAVVGGDPSDPNRVIVRLERGIKLTSTATSP